MNSKLKKFKKGLIYGVILTLWINLFLWIMGEKKSFHWFIDLLLLLAGGLLYGVAGLTKWAKYFMDEKYLEED